MQAKLDPQVKTRAKCKSGILGSNTFRCLLLQIDISVYIYIYIYITRNSNKGFILRTSRKEGMKDFVLLTAIFLGLSN